MNGNIMIPMAPAVTGCLVLSLAVLLAGCSSENENHSSQSMDDLAALLDNNTSSATASTETSPAQTPPAAPPVAVEPQVVTAKTPKKGRTLHDQGTYLSAVGSARFRTEHQMILNQVTHALDLYQAEHGEYPQSHEEFMVKIVTPTDIVVPERDEGQEYWYDASHHKVKFRPLSGQQAE